VARSTTVFEMATNLMMTLRASWRSEPDGDNPSISDYAEARSQDNWRWEFPAGTPMLAIFPRLPWELQAGALPCLDSEKLRGYLGVTAMAPEGAPIDVALGMHNFDPSALKNFRALLEAGMSREPVGSLAEWTSRVLSFLKQGKVELSKLRLSAANFVPNCVHPQAAPAAKIPNKMLWVHKIHFTECTSHCRSKTALPWVELAIVLGDISTEALQGRQSMAAAMSWSIAKAVAEEDAPVRSIVARCERAAMGERDYAYQNWAEPLAASILSFWQRTEWPPELFSLEETVLWRSSEVSWRVQYISNPDQVIAAKIHLVLERFPKLKAFADGAGSAFVMEAVRSVAEYNNIKTTNMQKVREVAKVVATYERKWMNLVDPHEKLAAILEAIADDEQCGELLKLGSKQGGHSTGAGAVNDSAHLQRFNDKKQWSNVLQGDKSVAFTAMVAALDVLFAEAEPDGVRIMEIGLRGADGSNPVHPMQLHILAEGKGTPLVHIVFANISPYRVYFERYVVECCAYPEGGCEVETSVSQHTFSKGFLTTLVSGQIFHEKVDLCRESERLEAVKLANYRPARVTPFAQRYLEYADYDVGPPMLVHILSSIGLKGTNPKYRFAVVVKWCKGYILPALNGSLSVLHDRIRMAKKILIAAMQALGRQCFVIRAMGPLDVGELEFQIPPSATVWKMMTAATEGIREGVVLREHYPSLARAADRAAEEEDAAQAQETK
jgi:hypothetical protein